MFRIIFLIFIAINLNAQAGFIQSELSRYDSLQYSTQAQPQQFLGSIPAIIDLIAKLIPEDEKHKPLIMVKANAKKGCLVKKYNRWLKRKKITQWQYDLLAAELMGIDITKLQGIQIFYAQKNN